MVIGVVPARGGSVRLPGKNLMVVGGVPLVVRAARVLLLVSDEVYVCTEDDRIASVAESHGIEVLWRPWEQSQVTLDDHSEWLRMELGTKPFVLYQPTVVGVQAVDLHRMKGVAEMTQEVVSLVARDTHRSWTISEDLEEYRAVVGRAEIGVRWYPPGTSGAPQRGVAISGEAVDIDYWHELVAARELVKVGRVHFEVTSGPGMGHLQRAHTIRHALRAYETSMVVVDPDTEGAEVPEMREGVPKVWVCDHLDTSMNHVLGLKAAGWRVVTFEDLGTGAVVADLVVNELYVREGGVDRPAPTNEVNGPDWAVMRAEFIGMDRKWDEKREEGRRVLVSFGGSDPSGLTLKYIEALEKLPGIKLSVVIPPMMSKQERDEIPARLVVSGAMGKLMRDHDILVCSAGRMVTEAAMAGIPAVVVAQNMREMTHSHLGPKFGNMYLGLGSMVKGEYLAEMVYLLISDDGMRKEMRDKAGASVDGRGVERITRAIEELMEKDRNKR